MKLFILVIGIFAALTIGTSSRAFALNHGDMCYDEKGCYCGPSDSWVRRNEVCRRICGGGNCNKDYDRPPPPPAFCGIQNVESYRGEGKVFTVSCVKTTCRPNLWDDGYSCDDGVDTPISAKLYLYNRDLILRYGPILFYWNENHNQCSMKDRNLMTGNADNTYTASVVVTPQQIEVSYVSDVVYRQGDDSGRVDYSETLRCHEVLKLP